MQDRDLRRLGALHAAFRHHQPRADHRRAVARDDIGVEHEVGGAVLILHREEDHALGAARPLADQHQAGQAEATALPRGGERPAVRDTEIAQPGAQQRQRMTAQREAGGGVVQHRLFPRRLRRQVGLRVVAGLAQRQRGLDAGGLPHRLAPSAGEGAQGIGAGQGIHRAAIEPRAVGEVGDVGERRFRAGAHDGLGVNLPQPGDQAQAEVEGRGGCAAPSRPLRGHPPPLRGRGGDDAPAFPLPRSGGQRRSRCAVLLHLQRAIPIGPRGIHRPHLHPMVARVAYDLRGGVEAHGLAVQQRRREGRRVVALDPGRDIDKPREARRMAFREAIGAEALDLLEAAFGEVFRIAAGGHAAVEILAELPDLAGVAEGRHGAAQLVRAGGGEAGGDDGDPHRLFLEQRHAERLAQHAAQFLGGVVHRFLPVPATQIGVHHVALDRAGAHDRDLDHQVVECARAQARQHVHLRAAFHLEHADGIRAGQHRIGRGVVLRHAVQRKARPARLLDQREGAADAAEHAKAEHIDLQDPERLDIVLVPFDRGAVFHRGPHHDGVFRQLPARDDEAADMGGEVAGEILDLLRNLHRVPDARVCIRIEAAFRRKVGEALPARAPDGFRDARGDVLRQAHRLADLPDRAAFAEADQRRGQRGAVAAIAGIDVLDHLLPPLMLEIHVDIGRLVARGADEAFEQQIVLVGRDGGDAERVAHRRIRRRAAPLAQNVPRLREAHDLMHRQEIGRVAQLRDQPQLMRDLLRDAGRHAARPAIPHRRRDAGFQRLLRGAAGVEDLVGIFIGQVAQGKAAGFHHAQRRGQRLGVAGQAARDLRWRQKLGFGIGLRVMAQRVHRAAEPDGGQHIRNPPARRVMVAHATGRDQRRADPGQRIQPRLVVAPAAMIDGAEQRQREFSPQPGRIGAQRVREIRRDPRGGQARQHAAFRARQQHVARKPRRALGAFHPRCRQHAAQPPPGRAIRGPGEEFGAVVEAQPDAGDEADTRFLRRHHPAHQPGHRIAIRDADGGHAERLGGGDDVSRVGRAFEEGEVRQRAEFGEEVRGGHRGLS